MWVCVLINRAALWVFPVFAVLTASLLGSVCLCTDEFVDCLRCLFAWVRSFFTALGFPPLMSQLQNRKRKLPNPTARIICVTNCTVSHGLLQAPGGFVNHIISCFFPRVNPSRMTSVEAVWDPPLWLWVYYHITDHKPHYKKYLAWYVYWKIPFVTVVSVVTIKLWFIYQKSN